MGKEIRFFYDLEAWQSAHDLALNVYKITKNLPASERFGIISQLQRAASSVSANIAEGFDRFHFNDKIKFYYQARGSVAEVQSFLFLARDLGFVEKSDCAKLIEEASIVRQLIHGLIRSIERQK